MAKRVSVKTKVAQKYGEISPNRLVTASNLISITRALLTLPIIYFLQKGNGTIALIFILTAIFSDMLDGWLARISNEITDIGKIIDPVADKIVIFSVILYLILKDMMPAYYFLFMIFRDFTISGLGLYMLNNCNVSPQSNKMGKVAILFTALSVLAFIYPDFSGSWTFPLMTVALVFMSISWIQYCASFIRVIQAHRRKKSV
ncbi:MAG: CDP-alcohol phosphatidyltransferase family protein [Candidatus Neomarinimicrobiota bacterium]